MLKRTLITLAAALLIAACTPRPAPPGDDTMPPRITLTALESPGAQIFTTDEGDTAPWDACAEVRGFPTTVSVAVTDAGGVRRVGVSVFPGRIVDASAGPATADVTITRERETSLLVIVPRPPAGTVQPNVVATFDVTEFSAIRASARDESGNFNELFQVDVRAPGDPVLCRGE